MKSLSLLILSVFFAVIAATLWTLRDDLRVSAHPRNEKRAGPGLPNRRVDDAVSCFCRAPRGRRGG